ncbi:MAG: hypothetical protein Tsb0014_31240 [Pleurocapsa sp.]
MVDSKPKARFKQVSSSIQQIVNLGLAAASNRDWSQVINCLQRLPLSNKKQLQLSPPDSEWQNVFKLSLAVLLQGDFQQQWEIAKLIPLLGKSIIEPLTILLADEEVELEVRWFICQILGKLSDRAVIMALVNLIQHTEEEELIAIASQTLTQIGQDAIGALLGLVSQSEHRLVAIQTLAYIRHPQIIEPLINYAKDPQLEIRVTAIEALGSFRDDRIPPILLDALQDKVSLVRKEAAIALGFRRDLCEELNLVNELKPLLKDLNLDVCRQAAISLGRMKNQAAATVLYETLQSSLTPVSLKLDIVKALGWMEIELAVEYLQRALTPESNPINLEIIALLGRISLSTLKEKASQILIDFWNVERSQITDNCIKQNLAISLGYLGALSAKMPLTELAQDKNRTVQLHAIAALKHLPN